MNNKHVVYTLLLAAACAAGYRDDKPAPIVRENPALAFDTPVIDEAAFNEEVTVSGTASSPNTVRDISFFPVKRTGETYQRLWFSPVQYGSIPVKKTSGTSV